MKIVTRINILCHGDENIHIDLDCIITTTESTQLYVEKPTICCEHPPEELI